VEGEVAGRGRLTVRRRRAPAEVDGCVGLKVAVGNCDVSSAWRLSWLSRAGRRSGRGQVGGDLGGVMVRPSAVTVRPRRRRDGFLGAMLASVTTR
jgi:hypothetical protein